MAVIGTPPPFMAGNTKKDFNMINLSTEMTAIIVNTAVETMAKINNVSTAIVLEAIVSKCPNALAQFEKLLQSGHCAIDGLANE